MLPPLRLRIPRRPRSLPARRRRRVPSNPVTSGPAGPPSPARPESRGLPWPACRDRPSNRAGTHGAGGPARSRAVHIRPLLPSVRRGHGLQWPDGHLRIPQAGGRSGPYRAAPQRRLLPAGHRPAHGPGCDAATPGSFPRTGLRPGPRRRNPAQRTADMRQRSLPVRVVAPKSPAPPASRMQSRPRKGLHPAPDPPLRWPPGLTDSCGGRRNLARARMPGAAVVHGLGDIGHPTARYSLGAAQRPASGRPVGPDPAGAARSGPSRGVHCGSRCAAPFPDQRHPFRRPGVPAGNRTGGFPAGRVPNRGNRRIRVPFTACGHAPGPRPEQYVNSSGIRRPALHAGAHLVQPGPCIGRNPGCAGLPERTRDSNTGVPARLVMPAAPIRASPPAPTRANPRHTRGAALRGGQQTGQERTRASKRN